MPDIEYYIRALEEVKPFKEVHERAQATWAFTRMVLRDFHTDYAWVFEQERILKENPVQTELDAFYDLYASVFDTKRELENTEMRDRKAAIQAGDAYYTEKKRLGLLERSC